MRNGLFAGIVVLLSAGAYACSVPVFRYALELWPQDSYRVMVLYHDTLDSSDVASVRRIAARAAHTSGDTLGLGLSSGLGLRSNIELLLENCKDPSSEKISGLWRGAGKPSLPFCAVLFPSRAMVGRPLYAGPLSKACFDDLFDSPDRRLYAAEICKGMSAVWLFIGSGDKRKDAAALKTLKDGVSEAKAALKLPDIDLKDVKEVVKQSDIDLRIDFSLITVSRSDKREQCLVDQLEKTEPELIKMRNDPMAFPVFARGRILYALVGKGINRQNIMDASSFLTGPCACTIKDQNPGMDMLMTFDWEAALANKVAIVKDAIPLVSLGGLLPPPPLKPRSRTSGTIAKAGERFRSARKMFPAAEGDSPAVATSASALPKDTGFGASLKRGGIAVKTAAVRTREPSGSIKRYGLVVPLFGGVFGLGALALVASTIAIGGTRRKRA